VKDHNLISHVDVLQLLRLTILDVNDEQVLDLPHGCFHQLRNEGLHLLWREVDLDQVKDQVHQVVFSDHCHFLQELQEKVFHQIVIFD